MLTKKWTWLVSAVLIVLMFALTGCQTVQGLDLAQAIHTSAAVKSSQSKSSLKLELVPGDTSKLTAEEKAALTALQNVNIDLAVLQQDPQHLSAEGKLTYSKGSVPFKLSTDSLKATLSIEGAKKPIVLDVLGGSDLSFLQLIPAALQAPLGGAVAEIKPAIVDWLLANSPNPANVTVTSAAEAVNGESLALQKAHIVLNGTETSALLQGLLQNLLADEDGLKEVISQLYDALQPVIDEQINAGSADLTLNLLKNKQLVVGLVFSPIHDLLEQLAGSLTAADASGEPSLTKDLLNPAASLQADIYFDTNKQIRKQSLAVNLPLPHSNIGASAAKITMASEIWNIDKPVKAVPVSVDGALTIGTDASSIYKVLGNLDKQSVLYTLLKNDLKVTKKEIQLATDGSGASADMPQAYINENWNTMVPVRFVSEKLGADVAWNGATREVTITDLVTGKTIVLTLDSTTALVNGKAVQLESAATLTNSSTYVPIRFIVEEALEANISFDEATHVVTIKRD